ncbi:MAG: hypothetical protein SPE30_09455 [Candidatus Treponema excrementipullorum]|nr:hypothetical protein [Spirochaetia bacterium]MCI7588227.1 hypothetical protein [Spirochaetia bacterium]MDY4466496.1 hypothetical protein [Candidatus Treponema excrementipullorum]
MYDYSIAMLPITVRVDTDQKYQRYEVPGMELNFIPENDYGHKEFTVAFLGGGKDGLALSLCAEVPKAKSREVQTYNSFSDEGIRAQKESVGISGLISLARGPKSHVFNDDCFELFIRPTNSDFYYGWEINAAGSCLDYRVSLKQGLLTATTSETTEPLSGIVETTIGDTVLTFDYDWQSNATWNIQVEDEFLYLELFIPWKDFGLAEAPAEHTVWQGTVNRIIPVPGTSQQALQSLLDFEGKNVIPRFHQPDLFAKFTWIQTEKPQNR